MHNTPLTTCTKEVLAALRALALLARASLAAPALDEARGRTENALLALSVAKEQGLVAPLLESEDGVHHALARRTLQQDREWRDHLRTHHAAWSAMAIHADLQGYRTAVQQLLRMAERRIAHQEQVLEPMVQEALAGRRRAA